MLVVFTYTCFIIIIDQHITQRRMNTLQPVIKHIVAIIDKQILYQLLD